MEFSSDHRGGTEHTLRIINSSSKYRCDHVHVTQSRVPCTHASVIQIAFVVPYVEISGHSVRLESIAVR